MAHGLDEKALLVMRWQWLPVPPVPLTEPLPATAFRDDSLFLTITPPPEAMDAFNFSFPQLSRQTADLRFYRLIQIFNTPLRSLSSRDAGRSNFAYWGGAHQTFRDEFNWAHLWFYADATDGDLVAVEYGFDGGLTLYSRTKAADELARRYREICLQLAADPA